MIDWEVTATTIFCESVNDEVTIIVNRDGAVRCSGRQKYEKPGKEDKKTLKTKSRLMGKELACLGENCAAVKKYCDKMLSEK
jgi:hypothetical protein